MKKAQNLDTWGRKTARQRYAEGGRTAERVERRSMVEGGGGGSGGGMGGEPVGRLPQFRPLAESGIRTYNRELGRSGGKFGRIPSDMTPPNKLKD